MQENQHSNGEGAPLPLYCCSTDNRGGPCPAHDCDGRRNRLLQMQRKQKTKDGQEVTPQDHLRCTITCRYSSKPRHYKDEYHIKQGESEKHKKAEEEDKVVRVAKGDPVVRITMMEDRGPLPVRLGGRGPPNPAFQSEQQAEKRTAPPPSPTNGCAQKGKNSTKRELDKHFECLQAARMEVKFPEER